MALPNNTDILDYPFPANARAFDFEFFRLVHQALIQHTNAEGIAGASTDLKVTTAASGLQLTVPAGRAFVKGDDRTSQGSYYVYNPTSRTVTASAAHATHPRIDRVVLRVYDADVSGGATRWAVEIIAGTPTAGATLTNLTGAASVPNGALLLANLLVPATFAGPFVDATHLQDRRFGLPIAGRDLAAPLSATSDSVGAGDKLGPLTVIGDGQTPVIVEGCGLAYTSGGGGTWVQYLIRDGASGTGTSFAHAMQTTAGASYTHALKPWAHVAAFSGSKSFYLNLQNSAGTPTACEATIGTGATRWLRATWATP